MAALSLNVSFRLRRDLTLAQPLVPAAAAFGPLGHPATDSANKVSELLIPFERGSFAAVERLKRIRSEAAKGRQFLVIFPCVLLKQTSGSASSLAAGASCRCDEKQVS